jgi:hypothetical protein
MGKTFSVGALDINPAHHLRAIDGDEPNSPSLHPVREPVASRFERGRIDKAKIDAFPGNTVQAGMEAVEIIRRNRQDFNRTPDGFLSGN